ncbi:MAG: amidase [Bacteroidales bacterium]|nr:amidase [Bacteroidales bacterium]MDT8431577.1 amidase [Bacteroidales bacterium]
MKMHNLFLLAFTACLFTSCNPGDAGGDTEMEIRVDSTYFAMNPMDIVFDTSEMKMIGKALGEYIASYREYREIHIPNSIMPALRFDPLPQGFTVPPPTGKMNWPIPENTEKPSSPAELAFMSIPELAALLRSGQVTSVELTTFFLDRLKEHDPDLHCVISYTEQYAVQQALKMDLELAGGRDRGILHGIPYGIKDLFAFPDYRTTWGAAAYREQQLDVKAGVIEQLEDAGAVLVAKLTLGALAMGDVWFADTTRNPWNPEQGSSGSSAGSSAATAAGLVPFAIGTETYGSIVSPATRCGVTGLRPTYGRVTRAGAMALSWSMDKVGPICRSAEDCAIVFDAIRGADPNDPTLIEAGFSYREQDLSKLRIGYFKDAFNEDYPFQKQDRQSLEVLRKLGADLVPVDLEVELPVDAMTNILLAEAAAAFDELTRSNRDTLLVRQGEYAWPALFRAARFMPAVEYIQANRLRTMLIEKYNNLLSDFDVIVTPSFGGTQLPATNMTGHPVVVVPNGEIEGGSRTSISFLGNLFDEATILALAKAYQDATNFDEARPPLFVSE